MITLGVVKSCHGTGGGGECVVGLNETHPGGMTKAKLTKKRIDTPSNPVCKLLCDL